MAGKGDTPRPLSVARREFENAWEKTFGPSRDTVNKEEKRAE